MKYYVKKAATPMEPWTPDIDMEGVSVSKTDAENGSPAFGDMIAANPENSKDRWLVACQYFVDNYMEAPQ